MNAERSPYSHYRRDLETRARILRRDSTPTECADIEDGLYMLRRNAYRCFA
jgi:hypothetical protein